MGGVRLGGGSREKPTASSVCLWYNVHVCLDVLCPSLPVAVTVVVGVSPMFGPQSGGTVLSLTGFHLINDGLPAVLLNDVTCPVTSMYVSAVCTCVRVSVRVSVHACILCVLNSVFCINNRIT